ncbi:MAG TPA: pantetheine-phosphate adenylyltransferase [Actinomycetota bacterium]|nr:pantetheine-phosphate adenylyltransferase [Actinomycetota bacterium]
MSDRIAVYPGTFDPITNGHLDIIERARAQFGSVVVAVSQNPSKNPLFPLEERIAIAKETTAGMDGVNVDSFEGLLVDYVRARGASALVKGLRAVTDFDYELQMAQMNYRLAGVETMFLVANPEYSFLSSSLVKEVARFGGDVEGMVPPEVLRRLKDRFHGER